MGTNYYLGSDGDVCAACGHEKPRLHIGKSSMGWVFSLHVIPEEGLNSLDDWKARWSKPGSKIVNEYGEAVTAEEMLSIIVDRGRDDPIRGFDFASNYAEPGPRNLVRSRISDWTHCVGHGDGTWSLHTGEFS